MAAVVRPRAVPAFAEGVHLLTPSRTITEADFAAIINVTWENGPLHTDAEYMKGTVFGRPILGGPGHYVPRVDTDAAVRLSERDRIHQPSR